MEWTAW
nr:unnamed protein product [Callosobruchus chinensis]